MQVVLSAYMLECGGDCGIYLHVSAKRWCLCELLTDRNLTLVFLFGEKAHWQVYATRSIL